MKLITIFIISLSSLSAWAMKCQIVDENHPILWNNTCNVAVDSSNLSAKSTKYLLKKLRKKGYKPYSFNIERDGEPWRALYLVPQIEKGSKNCKVSLAITRHGSQGHTFYNYGAQCKGWRSLCYRTMKNALKKLKRCRKSIL